MSEINKEKYNIFSLIIELLLFKNKILIFLNNDVCLTFITLNLIKLALILQLFLLFKVFHHSKKLKKL